MSGANVTIEFEPDKIDQLFENLQVVAKVGYTADYAGYVEFPTSYAGTSPPFEPLFEWVDRKWNDLDSGLKDIPLEGDSGPRPGSREHKEQVAWIVVMSIADTGTENRSHKRVTDAATAIGTLADAWAIELKSTSSTTAYVDAAEVTALERFAERFGADAYLAANFKRPGGSRSRMWLVAPEDARVTDGGAYGLPEADIAERARYAVLPATGTKGAEVRDV